MRFPVALALGLLAAAVQAAQVVVHLPENAAIRVWDPRGPERLDCPPDCAHQSPGDGHEILDLRVEPLVDPRTRSRPWDIVAMPGCRGTSALPADNASCSLPFKGDVDIWIQVRYRPILAVTYKGSYGGPHQWSITVNPGPDYRGRGPGLRAIPTATRRPRHAQRTSRRVSR